MGPVRQACLLPAEWYSHFVRAYHFNSIPFHLNSSGKCRGLADVCIIQDADIWEHLKVRQGHDSYFPDRQWSMFPAVVQHFFSVFVFPLHRIITYQSGLVTLYSHHTYLTHNSVMRLNIKGHISAPHICQYHLYQRINRAWFMRQPTVPVETYGKAVLYAWRGIHDWADAADLWQQSVQNHQHPVSVRYKAFSFGTFDHAAWCHASLICASMTSVNTLVLRSSWVGPPYEWGQHASRLTGFK